MSERYEPPSDFLKAVAAEDVPLAGSALAEANLRRLIAMTRDPDPVNRDWATFLLAQEEVDTPEVREALLRAAEDEHVYVRGEAILGLATLDAALALPLLRRELGRESVSVMVLEAAALAAHPSLAEGLRAFAEPSGDDRLDALALEALRACESGTEQAPHCTARGPGA